MSDTVIQDLDETLAVDVNETTDVQHKHQSDDDNDDDDHCDKNDVDERDDDDQTVDSDSDVSVCETLTVGTEDNESIQKLDNSITVLKQIAGVADKSKPNNGNTKNTFKCCDSCKVVHRVTAQSQASVPDRSGRMYRPAYRANTGKGRPGNNNSKNRPANYCHICMRNGHATQECWSNGRNEGWSMRQPR